MNKITSYLKWIFILLLISSIVTSLIWIYSISIKQSPQTKNHQIDSFVKKAESKQFSLQGKLIRSSNIAALIHYRDNNVSYFKEPTIVLYTDNSQPWHISSKDGKLYHQNHIIEFKNHVIVYQPKSDTESFTKVITSILFYNTQTHKAYTNAFVTIERQNSTTTAKGLIFNMKTNRMILKSNMQTHLASTSN